MYPDDSAANVPTNTSRKYTFTISDPAGGGDVAGVNILFNGSRPGLRVPDLYGTYACWAYYDRGSSTLSIASDDASSWNSAALAASGTLQNSFCSISWGQTPPINISGNTLTITLNYTFSNLFEGYRPVYVRALNGAGSDSGYRQLSTARINLNSGTITLDLLPSSTAYPVIRPGGSLSWALDAARPSGFTSPIDLSASLCRLTPGGATAGCVPELLTLAPNTIPSSSTTATAAVTTTNDTPPGIYSLWVGRAPTFPEPVTTASRNFGISNGPPTLSLSRRGCCSPSNDFYVVAKDVAGARAITGINVLINYSFTGQRACWLYFPLDSNGNGGETAAGVPYLANDDASVWMPITGSTPVTNSQCGISTVSYRFTGGTPTSSDATWLTDVYLLLTPIYSPTFSGPRTVYVRAFNRAGFDSGYQAFNGYVN